MKSPEFEKVSIEAHESIRVHHYTCTSFQGDHGWHFHPQFEISLILNGSGKRFVGDHIGNFYRDDIVLVSPNIAHCWMSENTNEINEMLVIQFDSSIFADSLLRLPEMATLKQVMGLRNQALLFCAKSNQELKLTLFKIAEYQGVDRLIFLLQFFSKVASVEWKELVSENFISQKFSRGAKRLTKVIDYVKENLSKDIKQPELAELICMTPQSFSRFFKSQTGRTFISFLNEMRITQACHLLITTDMDVLEIAVTCGYSSVSHFNKQFHENKKLTPSKYRCLNRIG